MLKLSLRMPRNSAQLVQHLFRKHGSWSLDPSTVQTGNPSAGEVKAGNSVIQGYFQPHGEFKAILGYLKPCLRKSTVIGVEYTYHLVAELAGL